MARKAPRAARRRPRLASHAVQRGRIANLFRRAVLTYRYLGARTVAVRAIDLPAAPDATAQPHPRGRRRRRVRAPRGGALVPRARPAGHGRDPDLRLARDADRRGGQHSPTTDAAQVRIVVADDASAPEHVAALRAIAGIELSRAPRTPGSRPTPTGGCAPPTRAHDVVLLNSDVVAHDGWLAALQKAAYGRDQGGHRRGRSCSTPTAASSTRGCIATPARRSGSTTATASSRADHGPANVEGPVLAVTGACMYVRRAVLDEVGPARRALPDGLRGRRLVPARLGGRLERRVLRRRPTLTHLESASRGHAGRRARAALPATRSGSAGATVLEDRDVRHARRAAADRLRHRGHGRGRRPPRRLRAPQPAAARGHEVSLYTLEPPRRSGSRWRSPCARFADYDELAAALAPVRRDQGRDLVAHRRSGVAGVGRRAECRSTSSRTSRPRTTPMTRARATPCSTATAPSSATSPSRGWNRERLRELGRDAGPDRPRASTSTRSGPLGTPRARRRGAGHRADQPAEELRR